MPAAADPNPNNSAKLRQAVTVAGIMEHQKAFQAIADAAGGNRLSGAPGHDGSADYVAQRAAAAGLDVDVQEFDYTLDLLADYETRFEMPREFVVPGATVVGAHLDVARTVVRRAERVAVALAPESTDALAYLNRLSDLLWALARWQDGTSLTARQT